MSVDELREHIARLTAADRRTLRTWLTRAYGIDGNPAVYARTGGTHRQPHGTRNAPSLGAGER